VLFRSSMFGLVLGGPIGAIISAGMSTIIQTIEDITGFEIPDGVSIAMAGFLGTKLGRGLIGRGAKFMAGRLAFGAVAPLGGTMLALVTSTVGIVGLSVAGAALISYTIYERMKELHKKADDIAKATEESFGELTDKMTPDISGVTVGQSAGSTMTHEDAVTLSPDEYERVARERHGEWLTENFYPSIDAEIKSRSEQVISDPTNLENLDRLSDMLKGLSDIKTVQSEALVNNAKDILGRSDFTLDRGEFESIARESGVENIDALMKEYDDIRKYIREGKKVPAPTVIEVTPSSEITIVPKVDSETKIRREDAVMSLPVIRMDPMGAAETEGYLKSLGNTITEKDYKIISEKVTDIMRKSEIIKEMSKQISNSSTNVIIKGGDSPSKVTNNRGGDTITSITYVNDPERSLGHIPR